MLLRASTALSIRSPTFEASPAVTLGSSLCSVLRLPRGRARVGSVVAMAGGEADSRPITGVVFQPFEELKRELALVPSMPDQSLARQKYSNECESALNEQIKFGFLSFLIFSC